MQSVGRDVHDVQRCAWQALEALLVVLAATACAFFGERQRGASTQLDALRALAIEAALV